jgi:hypothetical protein
MLDDVMLVHALKNENIYNLKKKEFSINLMDGRFTKGDRSNYVLYEDPNFISEKKAGKSSGEYYHTNWGELVHEHGSGKAWEKTDFIFVTPLKLQKGRIVHIHPADTMILDYLNYDDSSFILISQRITDDIFEYIFGQPKNTVSKTTEHIDYLGKYKGIHVYSWKDITGRIALRQLMMEKNYIYNLPSRCRTSFQFPFDRLFNFLTNLHDKTLLAFGLSESYLSAIKYDVITKHAVKELYIITLYLRPINDDEIQSFVNSNEFKSTIRSYEISDISFGEFKEYIDRLRLNDDQIKNNIRKLEDLIINYNGPYRQEGIDKLSGYLQALESPLFLKINDKVSTDVSYRLFRKLINFKTENNNNMVWDTIVNNFLTKQAVFDGYYIKDDGVIMNSLNGNIRIFETSTADSSKKNPFIFNGYHLMKYENPPPALPFIDIIQTSTACKPNELCNIIFDIMMGGQDNSKNKLIIKLKELEGLIWKGQPLITVAFYEYWIKFILFNKEIPYLTINETIANNILKLWQIIKNIYYAMILNEQKVREMKMHELINIGFEHNDMYDRLENIVQYYSTHILSNEFNTDPELLLLFSMIV